jgi:opacity protein-like surface antigen
MKKFCLLTLLVVIATSAAAQELAFEPQQPLPRNAVVYHHELALSYGLLSPFDLISAQNHRHFKRDILANYYHTVASSTGTFALAYKYRFNKVASLGATYSFGSYQTRAYEQKVVMAKEHIGYHTLAMECDFRYLTRRAVTLYSTIGMATTLGVRTERKVGGVVVKRD